MTDIAGLIINESFDGASSLFDALQSTSYVGQVASATSDKDVPSACHQHFKPEHLWSVEAFDQYIAWFLSTKAEYLLLALSPEIEVKPTSLRRLAQCAKQAAADLTYSDYRDTQEDGSYKDHPLVSYQAGSVRDNFDFGSMVLLSRAAVERFVKTCPASKASLNHAGWYRLRLSACEHGRVQRVREPLYIKPLQDKVKSGEKVFHYLHPDYREVQKEMEVVFTDYLKRIGAWLDVPSTPPVEPSEDYPITASVIIPVRNREGTIGDALESLLSQKADFDYNVLVVDNHSTDKTGDVIKAAQKKDPRVIRIVPERTDLVIGGCWEEAVFSEHCGLVAAQLDSDDLYSSKDVLSRIVHKMLDEKLAMLVGTYTTVDFSLNEMPPGLIDHSEWTDENGHNNALRLAGLGAPRVFHVPTLRTIGFPDVSYGEDYAVALAMTRRYRLGRIYESLYWCRRWQGNSDSDLSLEKANRYDSYKDMLRTLEIKARQQLVASLT